MLYIPIYLANEFELVGESNLFEFSISKFDGMRSAGKSNFFRHFSPSPLH